MFIIASLLFVLFTGSINAAQPLGGAMNMSPSETEWCYIVMAIDVVLVVVALAGAKLLGLTQRALGGSSILVGALVLFLGIYNQSRAPQLDTISDQGEMPVAASMSAIVYLVAISCITAGILMILRSARQMKSLK